MPAWLAAGCDETAKLRFPDVEFSYTSFAARVQHIARGLIGLGIEPGDRVGYFLMDGSDSLPVLFGIIGAGAVAVPINNRFKAWELSQVLLQSGVRALITATPDQGADLIGLVYEAFPSLPADAAGPIECTELPELQFLIDWGSSTGLMSRAAFDGTAEAVSLDAFRERVAEVDPLATAIIKYTSGTTGSPKGAMLSHAAILSAAAGAAERLDLRPDDRLWAALPLFHIGGVAFAVACFSARCAYVHPGVFDPHVAVEQIARHRATVCLAGFETIWMPVVDHPRFADVDQSCLRLVGCVGTEQRLLDIESRHPDAPVLNCFGQTEACGYLSLVRPDDEQDVRINTGGLPLPGMEARIVDPESGLERPRGQLGEICYRGPNAFDGYFRDEALTAAVWDDEGFFHTGDLGVMDEAGRVTFVNRMKDMLKVGGENVAAAEVEDYLLTHPAVHTVQVVAAPDARYSEVPAAFVQLQPGASLTEGDLIDFCRGQIATFRVPRYVRFVNEWPMSGTKIRKFELRDRIAAELAAAGVTAAPKIQSSDSASNR